MTASRPCQRCGGTGEVDAYWGPLCRPCAHHVAQLLDAHDRWPEVPWGEDEEVLLDGS